MALEVKMKSNGKTAADVAAVAVAASAPQSELEALKAENARLKASIASKRVISMKISEKGALSVYGLGRFPVTLYKGQWIALLAKVDALREALTDSRLKDKE